MILDTSIKVKINPSNYKYYLNKGYIFNKCGEEITVNVIDLPVCSHVKINCKCISCESEKKIAYYAYNNYIKNHGFYTCYKCCMIKNKLTSNEKYGGFYSSTKKYRDSINNTILEKYGSSENYSNYIRNITKIKVNEKYGVDNVFMLDSIKDKIKSSFIRKYKVEHALQNQYFFDKSQKSGFKVKEYNGIKYQGTYELDFLIFCEKMNLDVSKHKSIIYYHNNKSKIYYPDFYLKQYNLIIEIKSSYYYTKEIEKNLLKERYSKELGLNFLFIINKEYSELIKIIEMKKV
jgi:hypothetical protein